MQALWNIVGIIIRHDHQGTGTTGALTNTVTWPSATSAGGTVWVAILTDAVLVAVLEVWTFRHAVWTVACISTIVTHIGTLRTIRVTVKKLMKYIQTNKNYYIKNYYQNLTILVSNTLITMTNFSLLTPKFHTLALPYFFLSFWPYLQRTMPTKTDVQLRWKSKSTYINGHFTTFYYV